MAHLSYNEFKDRFGDLGITKYTKAMYLEEGCEEIGVLYCKDMELKERVSNCTIYGIMLDDYQTPSGIRIANDLYSYNFTLISDGRTWQQTPAYSVFGTNFSGSLGSYGNINVTLPLTWTDAQCESYLKDKVILYKKKGYYNFTFTRTNTDIKFDKTKNLKVTVLERTVIEKGSANDEETIAVYPGVLARNIKAGQSFTWTPEQLSSSTTDHITLYANGYDYLGSTGYKVKVRLKVEQ